MQRQHYFSAGIAGSLLLGLLSFSEPPTIKTKQMIRGNGTLLTVTNPQVAQASVQRVVLTGPWVDYVTAVNASGGVTGDIVSGSKVANGASSKITIRLRGNTATRGPKNMSVHVTCPNIPFTDCQNKDLAFTTEVLESGPITGISAPNGTHTVQPNSVVQFTVSGDAVGVSKILTRLTNLGSPRIVSQSTSSMTVSGTTPSCGSIGIGLIDNTSKTDDPAYRYSLPSNAEPILAGTYCPGYNPKAPTTCNSTIACPVGQTFNPATCKCQ